jgi:hypothetical protein
VKIFSRVLQAGLGCSLSQTFLGFNSKERKEELAGKLENHSQRPLDEPMVADYPLLSAIRRADCSSPRLEYVSEKFRRCENLKLSLLRHEINDVRKELVFINFKLDELERIAKIEKIARHAYAVFLTASQEELEKGQEKDRLDSLEMRIIFDMYNNLSEEAQKVCEECFDILLVESCLYVKNEKGSVEDIAEHLNLQGEERNILVEIIDGFSVSRTLDEGLF